MISTQIADGSGSGRLGIINQDGAFVTGAIRPTISESRQLNVANTAFNFFKVSPGEKFVLTGIILNADRFVSINGADVKIYETDAEDSLTELKLIIELDILRNATIPIIGGGQFEVGSGLFLNAKTTSVNINITMLGFFLPATGAGGLASL